MNETSSITTTYHPNRTFADVPIIKANTEQCHQITTTRILRHTVRK